MIYRPVENEGRTTIKSFFAGLGIYITFFALVMLASLFCISAFANAYYFSNVSGRSMQPTINPDVIRQEDKQDVVFVKVTHNVQPGDIVIIDEEKGDDFTLIKRVIATEGDCITILIDNFTDEQDDHYHTFVVRAGSDQIERLDESFIALEDHVDWKNAKDRQPKTDGTNYKTSFEYEGLLYKNYLSYADSALSDRIVAINMAGEGEPERMALFYKLGKDEIFYMGDHRSVSSDARERGTVTSEQIVGKVIKILPNGALENHQGMLWWEKIKAIFQYFWGKTEEFFAW